MRHLTTTPLLLVPGLDCTAALWAAQFDLLSREREVRIVDQAVAETTEAVARAVLAAAPERFAVAGFSFGGYVALEILHHAPERVERLALLSTHARADDAAARARRARRIGVIEAGGFDRLTAFGAARMLAPARRGDRDLLARLHAMATASGAAASLRQERAAAGRTDARDVLARHRRPTLIVVGAEDTVTPPERSREMAELVPGARFEILPGCGHFTPIEAADEVTALLAEWLAAPADATTRAGD